MTVRAARERFDVAQLTTRHRVTTGEKIHVLSIVDMTVTHAFCSC